MPLKAESTTDTEAPEVADAVPGYPRAGVLRGGRVCAAAPTAGRPLVDVIAEDEEEGEIAQDEQAEDHLRHGRSRVATANSDPSHMETTPESAAEE